MDWRLLDWIRSQALGLEALGLDSPADHIFRAKTHLTKPSRPTEQSHRALAERGLCAYDAEQSPAYGAVALAYGAEPLGPARPRK